jgi:hypothetical protein
MEVVVQGVCVVAPSPPPQPYMNTVRHHTSPRLYLVACIEEDGAALFEECVVHEVSLRVGVGTIGEVEVVQGLVEVGLLAIGGGWRGLHQDGARVRERGAMEGGGGEPRRAGIYGKRGIGCGDERRRENQKGVAVPRKHRG